MRTLGEAAEVDDTAAWVQRSRAKAAALALQMQAQDAESEAAAAEPARKPLGQGYSATHLAGLKVAHDESRFADGNVILTLRDDCASARLVSRRAGRPLP